MAGRCGFGGGEHDSARETYGPGRRAQHTFEKVGDRWEPKPEAGPSDEQAAGQPGKPTRGGVDATASRQHLYERAKQLGVPGRSRMSKGELVTALEKENRRRTDRARRSG